MKENKTRHIRSHDAATLDRGILTKALLVDNEVRLPEQGVEWVLAIGVRGNCSNSKQSKKTKRKKQYVRKQNVTPAAQKHGTTWAGGYKDLRDGNTEGANEEQMCFYLGYG